MTVPIYQHNLYQLRAQRVLRDRTSTVLAQYQLTTTEWIILGQIFEHKDGIRLAELATLLGVEAPLITNVVDGLVEKELVEKHAHPRDRRAKLIFLTKKGHELLPGVEALLQEEMRTLTKGVSEEEIAMYLKVLQLIIKNSRKV